MTSEVIFIFSAPCFRVPPLLRMHRANLLFLRTQIIRVRLDAMAIRAFYPFYVNRGERRWHETPPPVNSNSDSVKIMASLRGTFVLEARDNPYEVQASSALITPPFFEHGTSAPADPVEILVMSFRHLPARWKTWLLPANKPRLVSLDAHELAAGDDLHRRCLKEKLRGDRFSDEAVAGLANAWLAILLRASMRAKPVRVDARLHKARQQILTRFREPIRVGKLAQSAGMSEAHFRERYREVFGGSPKEEVLQLRARHAQDLLWETDLKLADIATQCGFCNEQEFSRYFRKHTGLPPGKWRRQT
jgi:AraC-like DNA-binding protein